MSTLQARKLASRPFGLPRGATEHIDTFLGLYYAGKRKRASLPEQFAAAGWTYARPSSTATAVDASGNVVPVAANIPRIDYDPLTLTPYGLLLEGQRTNELFWNTAFDNTWSASGGTSCTPNVVIGPDGTMSGDKIVENSATLTHARYRVITFDNVPYAISSYLKAGERAWGGPYIQENGVDKKSWVNLATGQISTSTPSAIVTTQQLPNAWWRVAWARTILATASGKAGVAPSSNQNINNYLGDGTSGIYAWGAQLEKGSFISSLIPTAGAAETRAADSLTRTIAQPKRIYFTVKVRTAPGVSGNQVIWSIGDATNGVMLRRSSNGHIWLTVYSGGSTIADLDAGGVGALGIHKLSVAMDGTTAEVCLNGGDIASATVAIPTLTTMVERLGSSAAGEEWFGHIQSFTVFSSLSDNEMVTRTAPPTYINALLGIDSLGDSPVTGYGRYLRDVMQARIGVASAGWVPMINASAARLNGLNWTGGGELTRVALDAVASPKTLDLQAHYWASVDGSSQAQMTPIEPYDQIDVVWAAAAGYGQCNFRPVGAGTVVLDGTLSPGVRTRRVEAFATPNVQLSWTAFTGPMSIIGVAFSRAGAGGFSYSPMGNGGWLVADLATVDDAAMRAVVAAIRPTHYLFNGGMNDRFNAPSVFEANARKVLDNIKAGAPRCKIVIVQSLHPGPTDTSNFSAYIPIKQQMTIDYGGQFLDLRTINPNCTTYALANAAGIMQDGVHPTTAFNRDVIAPWVADNVAW